MAKQNDLSVTWMDPKALKPYGNNAKLHPPEQINALIQQINSVGWTQPIVVDAKKVIIAGHGRWTAARQGKMPKVPVVVLTHLSEAQVKAARLADNKVAESPWNHDLLKIDLDFLFKNKFDLGLTGFSLPEIDAIRLGWGADSTKLANLEENSDPARTVMKLKMKNEDVDAVRECIVSALNKADLFTKVDFE